MAQQTAVEWLVNQINGHSHSIGMPYRMSIRIDIPDDIIEQAKAMEKHQTLVFGMKCQGDYNKYDFHRNIVDIYNEAYNK